MTRTLSRHKQRIYCVVLLLIMAAGTVTSAQPRVRLGNEILIQKEVERLHGKRVGLITNHTGRLSSGEFLLDAMLARGVNVVALFAPEHGVRGTAAAGEHVADSVDAKSGIRIYSLYGTVRKPTPAMLTNIDLLVYDIQDVGARFYTYVSTMGLCMEAAAKHGIPFIVLDRPNPLGGVKVDGPIVEDSLRSFVGMYPIPVVYGLTCGELAMMINEEGWLANRAKCALTVITMQGWKRTMTWEETGLQWIPPSPNITSAATAFVYPATCFVEATNLSEGRGTEKPFHRVGTPSSPEADSIVSLIRTALSSDKESGLHATPISFTPLSSKHHGTTCIGLELHVVDWKSFQPVATGLFLLQQFMTHLPSFELREPSLLRLAGSRIGLDAIQSNTDVRSIARMWVDDCEKFRRRAQRYWLYRK